MTTPAQAWAEQLSGWGIPEPILSQAPTSPWVHPVALFTASDEPEPVTVSTTRALEALPEGGSVLDVGCGGGRAGLALLPRAEVLTGVDTSPAMLAELVAASTRRGVPAATVQGRWPDVEAQAPVADVVLCHHVLFNVADLLPFVQALSAHARRRVVVEIPQRHPLAGMSPLWQQFWGLQRPDGPTEADAADVVAQAGFDVHVDLWETTRTFAERAALPPDEVVALNRVRLCLPPERDPEVAAALAALGPEPPRRLATLWWDV